MLKIDDVEILSLDVVMYGERTNIHEIDLGSLTLKNNGRGYTLDAIRSITTIDGGFSTVSIELEKDVDTFPETETLYDLKTLDLLYGVDATFYIASDLPIEHITLFVRYKGMTQAIEVVQE